MHSVATVFCVQILVLPFTGRGTVTKTCNLSLLGIVIKSTDL